MANGLIPHKEWLKRTSVIGKPRSKSLKAVDEALRDYEGSPGGGAALWGIEQKLKAWQASKGPGDAWRSNARNKKDYAIDELDTLLTGKSPETAAPSVPKADMDNARLGVLYLFSHTEVSSNIFNVALEGGLSVAGSVLSYSGSAAGGGNATAASAATNLGTAMVPGSVLLQASESAVRSAEAPQLGSVRARFQAWLEDFARKVMATLKEKFGEVDVTIAAIKNLLKVLSGVFLENAAPFISAGMDIVAGLANTGDATVRRLKSWWEGRGVTVLPGHPSTIVDAIKKAMTLSIFEGLYQTLRGAGSVGLEFLSGAASMIINVVVAIVETVIKIIWRLFEIGKMKKFFAEARHHWQTHGIGEKAFHRDFVRFNSWYKSYVASLPVLAILTLNSGICGDKMRFLKMFKTDQSIVTQAEFDKGVIYVDGLKANGAKLLGDAGYDFSSEDKVVEGLLSFAGKHGSGQSTAWDKVLKVVNA